ncbi:GFA family protein [Nitrosomonas sp. HPC101]|uniref:GFA family protein n=1 Tax=Nitrosomonas sp. HPC101 TaxID=1658667 RepID=UPI00136B9508|nr:GFA family protein [Nitrosomonas sp. HPC101]MXS85684.1 GFA family protein [Nitrosomonas sp. HPC101]
MHGSCLCGVVTFEVSGTVPKLYQCHCSLCRKQSGSTSNTATIVQTENFRWLSGESLISSYRKPTGFRSDFCSVCGSTLPNPLRNTPYYWVPAGAFDDQASLEVTVHLHLASKAPWDISPHSGVYHETMPELSAIIQALYPNATL